MIEVIWLLIGFVLGVVVVGLAIELGGKKPSDTLPASRHTKSWSISEIANPRIMAETLDSIDIPKNSKILVNQVKNQEMLNGLDFKQYGAIKGNFIIGDDRVLILSGPVKEGAAGIWTVEKEIVEKLNEEFENIWTKADQIELEPLH